MKQMKMGPLLFFKILWISLVGIAQAAPPLFGPEFNFTNEDISRAWSKGDPSETSTPVSERIRDLFIAQVKKNCPECKIKTVQDKFGVKNYLVEMREGWNFTIGLDPKVIEVQTSPMTQNEIRQRQSLLQRLIFDVAHSIGLTSLKDSGHMHIGVEAAFGEDALLFRNFILDWIIHSRMAFMVFGGSKLNSPTIDMLGMYSLRNFYILIQQFDMQVLQQREGYSAQGTQIIKTLNRRTNGRMLPPRNLFAHLRGSEAIQAFMEAMNTYVYNKTVENVSPPQKYQNLNLSHGKTIELRCVREQASAQDFLLWSELLQGRLHFLRQKNSPILITEIARPASPAIAMDLFYQYLKPTSLAWRYGQSLVSAAFRSYSARPPLTCEDVF